MKKGFFFDAGPVTKITLTGLIVIVCFIGFFILALVLAIPLFGKDPVELVTALSDPLNRENLALLKYLQIMQSTGLFLIPAIILAYLFSGHPFRYLMLKQKPTGMPVLIILLIFFSYLPVINLLTEINMKMNLPEWLSSLESWMKRSEESARLLTEAFLSMETTGAFLFNLFMIAIIPAIGEELLFRGVIQRIFTDWTKNKHLGILIAAILFSALHLQFYGFLPRLFLGVVFGYLLVYSQSMWYPVIAHFLNNAFAVGAYYFIGKEGVEESIDQFGAVGSTVTFALIGLILVIILIHSFRSTCKND